MSTKITRLAKISETHRAFLERAAAFPAYGRVTNGGVMDYVAGQPGRGERDRDHGQADDDNFNEDGSRKDRRERKPDYKVELLCRTFAGDVGIRPVDDDIIFWESPDIWIEGPSGDPDHAIPGVVNKVKVHIWNIGLADCWGAQVDLFVCDPSVGISAALAKDHIGPEVVPHLPPGGHVILSFDWTPEFEKDIHQCLVVQVHHPLNDPVVAPFNPVQDRHVGQRNISVVSVEAGQSLEFEFFSQNLSWVPASTTLELQRLEGPALRTLAIALGRESWTSAGASKVGLTAPEPIRAQPTAQARTVATGVFRLALQDVPARSEAKRVMNALRSLVVPDRQDRGSYGQVSESEDQRAHRTGGYDSTAAGEDLSTKEIDDSVFEAVQRVRLEPGRFVRLALQTSVPTTAAKGSADVYRIVERAADRITGGLTIVVETGSSGLS